MIEYYEVQVLKKLPVLVGIEVGKTALARDMPKPMWDRFTNVHCSPIEMSRSDCTLCQVVKQHANYVIPAADALGMPVRFVLAHKFFEGITNTRARIVIWFMERCV